VAVTVTKRKDPSTQAERFVIGDRRAVTGSIRQPQAKYVVGGFSISPAELGFDKVILDLKVNFDKEAKAIPVVERVSDTEWKLKFYSAVGVQFAAESEAMNGIDIPFLAIGE
jgi:hypothetical protein